MERTPGYRERFAWRQIGRTASEDRYQPLLHPRLYLGHKPAHPWGHAFPWQFDMVLKNGL